MLFVIIGFFASPIGAFCILLGFLSFFILPVLSAATSFKKPTGLLFWLAARPVRRAAVLVSEANDIVFKQMHYDGGVGLHSMTIDGDTKVFEDPDGALHRWRGMAFALADEKHGVLFDPRHSALGQRKFDLRQRGDGEYIATDEEFDVDGITKWKPGVFQMPTVHELVDLAQVRELIDGGERSEYAKRVEKLFQHSQDPFNDGAPITKFFYPIIAFAAVFFGIWLLASQFGTPSSGGGGGSTVGWNALLLLAIPGAGIEWRRLGRIAAGVFLGVVVPLAILGVIAVLFTPLLAVAVVLAYALGFFFLPFFSLVFGMASATVAGAFSKLYFRLGFMGYAEPVFEWTPRGYRLQEYRNLDDSADVRWYGLFGSRVGFTYAPDEESWGAEVLDTDDIKEQRVAADGGDAGPASNLPDGYHKLSSLRRDRYGAFLPETLNDDSYYLHSGIALNRFKNSAVGEKALRRLLEAKEKFGGEASTLDDKTVLYLTAGAGLLGFGAGVFFFLL